MYNKKYYDNNKDKYRASDKKYKARIKEEKIAAGIIILKPIMTPEERIAHTKARQKRRYEDKKTELLAYSKSYYAEQYKNPEFRAAKLRYLIEYRKKKKLKNEA